MSKIQKANSTSPKKKSTAPIKNEISYSVGDIFLYNSHDIDICRISKITKKDVVYERLRDDETWGQWGNSSIEDFNEKHASRILKVPLEEFMKEVNEVLDGKRSIEDFRDQDQPISDSTDLMRVTSKDTLEILRSSLEEKKNRADLMKAGLKMEIQRRMGELDEIRKNLGGIVEEFKKKIEQVNKVIYTIELYLGIQEDIVQIQSGESSSDTIHFWQKTLFMDEEVGDPMDDMAGLDYSNIEHFDKWLLKYSKFYKKHNYELLIPQSKGLMCLRVRRNDKDYFKGDDSISARYANQDINEENRKTYILIRNGTNLYRIWGDIRIYPQLFPSQEELQDLRDMWDKLEKIENPDNLLLGDGEIDLEDSDDELSEAKRRFQEWGDDSKVKEKKEQINNRLFRYKQHFIMLQGLLDRTEIFYPIPETISLMSPEPQEKGLVKFVYDDDMRLSDGRISFADWRKQLNENIQEGSRIVFVSGVENKNHDHTLSSRFDRRFAHHYDRNSYREETWNLPSLPETGLYHAKTYKTKTEEFVTAIANSKSEVPEYELKDDRYDTFNWDKMEDIPRNWDDPRWYPHKYDMRDEQGKRIRQTIITEFLAIYYNPNDVVRNNWDYWDDGHQRKNSVSFKVFPKDTNILNYDGIDLDDVDHYLYDRRHRKDYLQMMPILWKIKQLREEELKKELEFVKGLIQDMQKNNQKISNPKESIWEAIEWFKVKNKWKRPLTENDVLAWKLIRQRLGLKKQES